jgi:hypothetical protein
MQAGQRQVERFGGEVGLCCKFAIGSGLSHRHRATDVTLDWSGLD